MNKKKELVNLVNLTSILLNKYQNIIGKQHKKNTPPDIIAEEIVNYYESIINCMPGNVYWLDKDCITVGCNKNVLDMFGFKSLNEFKGLTFEQMGEIGGWTPEATQSFKNDTMAVIASGEPRLNIEEPPIPHSDGRTLYFLTSRVPLFDHTGASIGIVGISIDISDRKEMEQELKIAKKRAEEASHAKTIFLANISHDIKTPLAGIIGTAEHLVHVAESPKFKKRAKSIVEAGLSLLKLMSELIEISRGELEKPLPTQNNHFQLKKLIKDLTKLVKPAIDDKHLYLKVRYAKDIPHLLLGDHEHLYRILLNLIANAVKFTNQGGITFNIKLDSETETDAIVTFNIKDTGIGIPKEKQAIIFDRFTRLTPSYEGTYQGNGLGLSFVKEFIEKMQGEIHLESTEGEGSIFTCTFPFKKIIQNEPTFKHDNLLETHALFDENNIVPFTDIKILLIEDNLIAARAAMDTLISLGCHVEIANNGKDALRLFEVGKYDLIYIDIGLPDMDGCEVTKKIRQLESKSNIKTHITALSAHIDEKIKSSCLACGMDAVLMKPLLRNLAINLIGQFVSKKKLTPTLT